MKLLYFAWVRDRVGIGEEDVTPPAHVVDVAGLMAWQVERGGGHAEAFAEPARLRAAVNMDHARPEDPVKPGDEVAFFPPVTGG